MNKDMTYAMNVGILGEELVKEIVQKTLKENEMILPLSVSELLQLDICVVDKDDFCFFENYEYYGVQKLFLLSLIKRCIEVKTRSKLTVCFELNGNCKEIYEYLDSKNIPIYIAFVQLPYKLPNDITDPKQLYNYYIPLMKNLVNIRFYDRTNWKFYNDCIITSDNKIFNELKR